MQIGGTYAKPVILPPEVAIGAIGRIQVCFALTRVAGIAFSADFPPMWPGSILVWCHMWIEFVVGSRPAPKVFLWVFGFSSFCKKPTLQIPIHQDTGPAWKPAKADVTFFSKYCHLYCKLRKNYIIYFTSLWQIAVFETILSLRFPSQSCCQSKWQLHHDSATNFRLFQSVGIMYLLIIKFGTF